MVKMGIVCKRTAVVDFQPKLKLIIKYFDYDDFKEFSEEDFQTIVDVMIDREETNTEIKLSDLISVIPDIDQSVNIKLKKIKPIKKLK